MQLSFVFLRTGKNYKIFFYNLNFQNFYRIKLKTKLKLLYKNDKEFEKVFWGITKPKLL